MAMYGYQCDLDGSFDVKRPIGTAVPTLPCPTCGAPAARVFTAPMLGLANRKRLAVLDHAEASRFEPSVVSSPPSRPRPGRGRGAAAPRLDPRASTLPRP
jgi:hypothetical protein